MERSLKLVAIWLPANNQIKRIMERITFVEKGSRTIYRLGRRIVCYRDGYRVYFGKPSDVTHYTFDALSENIAHEYCLKVCERKKCERVKYNNPVSYNAHRVLSTLAQR